MGITTSGQARTVPLLATLLSSKTSYARAIHPLNVQGTPAVVLLPHTKIEDLSAPPSALAGAPACPALAGPAPSPIRLPIVSARMLVCASMRAGHRAPPCVFKCILCTCLLSAPACLSAGTRAGRRAPPGVLPHLVRGGARGPGPGPALHHARGGGRPHQAEREAPDRKAEVGALGAQQRARAAQQVGPPVAVGLLFARPGRRPPVAVGLLFARLGRRPQCGCGAADGCIQGKLVKMGRRKSPWACQVAEGACRASPGGVTGTV